MSLQDKVLKIVAKVIKQPVSSLNTESGLSLTNNWDSLHHTYIVLELEEAFDISFDFDEMEKLISIKFIVSSLEDKGVSP